MSSHTYYAPALSTNSIVIDLGASTAAFSQAMADLYGCRCYVAEATSHNITRIKETELISKFHYAIAGEPGKLKLWIADDECHWGSIRPSGEFKFVNSEEVPAISFPMFLDRIGVSSPDLVKIDIEGAEFELFDATSDHVLQSVGQLTVEFHDFMNPDWSEAVNRLKERMADLGFQIFSFSGRFNGDVLFLNRRMINLSAVELLKVSFGLKFFRGFIRIAKRIL